MNLLLVCFVVLIGSAAADVIDANRKPTPVIIREDGYPVEIHNVTTPDGYQLQAHRIPSRGKPVLVIHGLLCSSSDWVLFGPNKSLAYLLADRGYDVWLGNARGNTYSKNMTGMSALKKKNYWNFSWHEIGYYDLPTIIDYILAITGYKKLAYIGHSQGGTVVFVLLSTRPEYNDKITAVYAMAPATYFAYSTSILIYLISLTTLPLFFSLVDGFEFLPSTKLLALIGNDLCNDMAPTQSVCGNAFMALLGMSKGELNDSMLPIILGHLPAGASNRQLLHYGQVQHCDCFRWYDYGLATNLIVYNSPIPPKYNLSMVTVPGYYYCGANDIFVNPKDADRFISELGNPMKKILVSNPNWQHLDFPYGEDARTEVYDPIINQMQSDYPN